MTISRGTSEYDSASSQGRVIKIDDTSSVNS